MRLDAAVEETLTYLSSPAALAALRRDPYWPKWDAPWWRMTLLWELGLARRIPRSCAESMCAALETHYLRFFPARLEDVPAGADPVRHVACHCALGTIVQVLFACGITVAKRLPWIKPWFLRYQLPDGGLNCDESAYAKPDGKSSVVSTLPPLEAMLGGALGPLGPEEEAFLDRGADYLLRRRLFRRLATGAPINRLWLRPFFPRFYEYDILRGCSFIAAWARRRGRPLPAETADALALLRRHDGKDGIEPGAPTWSKIGTIAWDADSGWTKRERAFRFPLLEAATRPIEAHRRLGAAWEALQAEVAA